MLDRSQKYFRSLYDYPKFFIFGLSSHPKIYLLVLVLTFLVTFALTRSRGPSNWGLWQSLVVGVLVVPFLNWLATKLRTGEIGGIHYDFPDGILEEVASAKQIANDQPSGMVMIPAGANPGPIMNSPQFDSELRSADCDWNVTKNEHSEIYARVIENLKEDANHWRLYGQSIFLKQLFTRQPLVNEKKILFETPLSLGQAEVVLGRTDYFAGMCTADLSLKDGERIWPNHDNVFPVWKRWGYHESVGQLYAPPLVNGSVPMSLHLGVDVIIITRDKILPLAIQGKGNLQSPLKTLPFGSGSMDWDDIEAGAQLKTVVLKAARRELSEEWGGPNKNAKASRACSDANLKVIGLYREMLRGGKPQFVVAGRVDLDYSQLIPEKAEVVRSKHPEAAQYVANLAAAREFADWVLTSSLGNLPKRSQALFGAFHCFRSAIDRDAMFMSDLLELPKA